MQLRIAGARRPMAKRRGDQSRCLLDDAATVTTPNRGGIALEVSHRLADSLVMSSTSARLQLGVAEPEEHAGTLRSRERQIEARDAGPTRRAPQLAPVAGMRTVENSPQTR